MKLVVALLIGSVGANIFLQDSALQNIFPKFLFLQGPDLVNLDNNGAGGAKDAK